MASSPNTEHVSALSNNSAGPALECTLKTSTSITATNEMASDGATSPLLRLPGKLRNQIYAHITNDIIVEFRRRAAHKAAMLRVCKQLYAEFSDYFFASAVMKLEVWDRNEQLWKLVEDRRVLQAALAQTKVNLAVASVPHDMRQHMKDRVERPSRCDVYGLFSLGLEDDWERLFELPNFTLAG